MRKACLNMVYKLAVQDDRIFFIGSDLTKDTLVEFKEEMPDRFFMEGISEQNVVGMAAGLALDSKIVYVNTIASFLTRRCYEQVAIDVCLQNLKVRLIGNGGGMVYAPLGSTHLAVEDISIMRALPNMTIVAVADAEEMKRFMGHTVDYPGPIYIRLAKGYDPIVTDPSHPFEIGRAISMRHGMDALIISTGICLGPSLEAAGELAEQGIDAGVLHVHTIKPLDEETILDAISGVRAVVTMEEHTVLGGLGSAVAELLAESGSNVGAGFKRLGIPDRFPDKYGTQKQLMARFNITMESAVEAIKELLG